MPDKPAQTALAFFQSAVQHHQNGQLDKAGELYQQALALEPEHFDALHLFGMLKHQLGAPRLAIEMVTKALLINPNSAAAHGNFGVILKSNGQLEQAVSEFQKALALQPNKTDALFNLGNTYKLLMQDGNAIESYQKALALDANHLGAYTNLGQLYHALGQFDEAINCYERLLKIQPNSADGHCNMGIALFDLGQIEKAHACYKTSLSLEPANAKLHYNLGIALQTLGKLDEAAASYKKSIELQPDLAEPHANLATVYRDCSRVDDAISELDLAISIKPERDGWHIKRALMLPIILSSKEEIDRRRELLSNSVAELMARNLLIKDPLVEVGITSFYLTYHNRNDRRIAGDIAGMYLQVCPELSYEASHCSVSSPDKKEKLKLGILSNHLKAHTIGRLFRGLIEQLSREKFEVIILRPVAQSDAISKAIDASADQVITLSGRLDQDRKSIAKLEFDVLFYPDIGMTPYTYYLAFARLAPVQAVSWGHPDTTGIPNIDYFLSSTHIEPQRADTHYSEQLIQFQTLPTYNRPPAFPAVAFERATYGMNDDMHLYVCPQSLFKFHPDFDVAIANILAGDPKGRLVLIDHKNENHLKERLLERLRISIPDAVQNILFLPQLSHEEYLALCIDADALLDTPTFSGGHSSQEAFAMGVPIVTWPTEFMRGRVTAGCYNQMGVTDLIADSADGYVNLALQLANDLEFKKRMRNKITTNSHKLFERVDLVEEIETFFMAAHEAWRTNVELDLEPYL